MNLDELQRKLFSAARACPPGDAVPYAFEKRIMARLQQVTPMDTWSFWGQALWRAAAPCVAVMLLFAAWTTWSAHSVPNSNSDLSQALENTFLVAADQEPVPESL